MATALCIQSFYILGLVYLAKSCAPPLSFSSSQPSTDPAAFSFPAATLDPGAPFSAAKVLGDPTQSNNQAAALSILPGPVPAVIKSPVDLFCYDFDAKCRWKNMEGLFIDELDWFQGSGFLDESKLHTATGTDQTPDGYYGIVATDHLQLAMNKAVLVSDIIDCQTGSGEVRFSYWISPGVKMLLCTKTTDHLYPNYDYCADELNDGGPGPAFISIPDLDGRPFQIYIRAENFVHESEHLKGGFAIIDNIEYYGDLCGDGQGPPPLPEDVQALPSLTNQLESFSPKGPTLLPLSDSENPQLIGPLDISKHRDMDAEESFDEDLGDELEGGGGGGGEGGDGNQLLRLKGNLIASSPTHKVLTDTHELESISMFARQKPRVRQEKLPFALPNSDLFAPRPAQAIVNAGVCQALNCTFSTGFCLDQLHQTPDWKLTTGPVGNPVTGIRGDASLLPYNKDGYYAYVEGPKAYSRFQMPSFTVDDDVLFVFAYYKASRNAEFRLVAKKQESAPQVLFEAPKTTVESKRWFREGKKLSAGVYDYIAFEVANLGTNAYVGIDEMVVLDARQQPFCQAMPALPPMRSSAPPTNVHDFRSTGFSY